MASIVKHKKSEKHFLLIGTGYGAFQSARPGMFFGDLLPTQSEGVTTMVALGFPNGKILWCDSREVELVSVDGKSPSEILSAYN